MARILIVEARFYDHLNDLLLEGARAAIESAGHSHETVTVPGALQKQVAQMVVEARLDDQQPGHVYSSSGIGRSPTMVRP